MVLHIKGNNGGFAHGHTVVTRFDEEEDNTGIEFSVLNMNAGEKLETISETETAYLLMQGEATFTVSGQAMSASRRSIFDQSPYCVHLAAGEKVVIDSQAESEITVFRTANTKPFEVRFYGPDDVPNEHRGRGQVDNACYRFVRTIFDDTNSDSNAELVLGEVVTLPGRWSSYPPHHHPQPEIYHYRFTEPQGYGHAELGDDVLKVKQCDTVKIFDGFDHPQCAAPGYGMYYLWVIRHLPGNRYTVPVFTEEHKWIQGENPAFWRPQGID